MRNIRESKPPSSTAGKVNAGSLTGTTAGQVREQAYARHSSAAEEPTTRYYETKKIQCTIARQGTHDRKRVPTTDGHKKGWSQQAGNGKTQRVLQNGGEATERALVKGQRKGRLPEAE